MDALGERVVLVLEALNGGSPTVEERILRNVLRDERVLSLLLLLLEHYGCLTC